MSPIASNWGKPSPGPGRRQPESRYCSASANSRRIPRSKPISAIPSKSSKNFHRLTAIECARPHAAARMPLRHAQASTIWMYMKTVATIATGKPPRRPRAYPRGKEDAMCNKTKTNPILHPPGCTAPGILRGQNDSRVKASGRIVHVNRSPCRLSLQGYE
jgi:hypothetical protein